MKTISVHIFSINVLFFACMQVPANALAQVTYFNTPPTPQQVEEALHINGEAKPGPVLLDRGIKWNNTGVVPVQQQPASGLASTTSQPAVAVPVNFEPGSSQIKKSSLTYLDAIASALTRNPFLQLKVEGHSDASGDARRNLMLSWERAFTVFKLLVVHYGIDPARLRPIGRGDAEPMQGAAPTESINRRVQFRVMDGPAV